VMRFLRVVALISIAVALVSAAVEASKRILRTRRRTSSLSGGGDNQNRQRQRILYVVTTLAEYNTGTRSTVRGSDRLQETLIPVVSDGVRSMRASGFDVDLFLICHFTLLPERQELIRRALPSEVGLQVWNDATPLGYDTSKEPNFEKLENRTLHLSRQHRFVVKDKLLEYDVFACFEDDMLVTGRHVEHYVAVTEEIERLREQAPDELPDPGRSQSEALDHYHGVMTKQQLARTIPGFIRVEVLLDEDEFGAQKNPGPVPIDLDFGKEHPSTVDPTVCCHISESATNENRPRNPSADKLMLWETNILPLGVRKMPDTSWLNWVVTQRGPNQQGMEPNEIIGDYWTNRDGAFYGAKQRRPAPQEFKYINNQGGWMATRRQLWRWHTEICPGGFLPPYEAPHYRYDGLDMRNVEWYSGAMQLSTVRHACNMQRIILLDPEHFSKSLIYHTANNKQRQLAERGRRESFTKANTLLGQLNTVKKKAEREMK